MIELTAEQMEAVETAAGSPAQLVNPRTKETFVLLRTAEYDRLKVEYDDTPWTRAELESLAWVTGKQAGWEDMTEYDDVQESA